MMLMLAALLQTIPVPDVVLTRREADAMSDAAIEARLLGDVPHGPIVRVDRQRDFAGVTDPPRPPLNSVTFHEVGTPASGSLCRGRRILVQFYTLDGRLAPPHAAPVDETLTPRRVFAISPYPTLAILADRATPARCAAASHYVQLPPRAPDEGVAMVEMLRSAGRTSSKGSVGFTCSDDIAASPGACDSRRETAAVDWTRLLSVSSTHFTGEPLTWRIIVASQPGMWTFVVTPLADAKDRGWQVRMTRGNPPPF